MANPKLKNMEGKTMNEIGTLYEIFNEKTAFYRVAEMRLRPRIKIITDNKTTDREFFAALRDVCIINKVRDAID